MLVQLLVALVEAIDRQEERLGVGDVNRDGEPERAAGFPHRIEPLVVDRDQGT
jgi:hypothetical protein